MSSLWKSNGEIWLDKTEEREEENIWREDRLQMPKMRSSNALKARLRQLASMQDFVNGSYAHPILSNELSD